MSFVVNSSTLQEPEREAIKTRCIITEKPTPYNPFPKKIYTYEIVPGKYIKLPLAFWGDFYEEFPNNFLSHKRLSNFEFKGKLISDSERDQEAVVREGLTRLRSAHCCLLALRTGYGKSLISIYLALRLGYKIAIICHYRSLHPQWESYFKRFTNLKVQVLSALPKREIDQSSDVYILGAKKASKLEYLNFVDVGTVVVDEVESICTEVFLRSLWRFRPRYLIGCSATPDRPDGLDKILYNYFGPRSTFIFRSGKKAFSVVKIETSFVPDMKYNRKRDLDWNAFIGSLSYNTERQHLICRLVQRYKNNRILVFVKRIAEMENIVALLKGDQYRDSVDFVSTRKKTYDKNCRVLLGTYKKIGVGFDVTDREVTIFAGDTKDIRQPEGRVRLQNNTIVDIVDNSPILQRHWAEREKWYRERGAIIEIQTYLKT